MKTQIVNGNTTLLENVFNKEHHKGCKGVTDTFIKNSMFGKKTTTIKQSILNILDKAHLTTITD